MESDTADSQSNNTNNKENKPFRQTTITLKRKLANEDAKTTEPPSKRLKLSMQKRQLSINKTNTISPSNTSRIRRIHAWIRTWIRTWIRFRYSLDTEQLDTDMDTDMDTV